MSLAKSVKLGMTMAFLEEKQVWPSWPLKVTDLQFSSVAQSCPTLCDPMDCSPPGSFVHGDSQGKTTRGVCHSLLQGIFPTQGSNLGLLYCRWILYHLSHQGSPDHTIPCLIC